LARVFVATVVVIAVEVGVAGAFGVVVVRAVLVCGVHVALIVQMLRIGPIHMAGLLGGSFGRSLAVASANLVICLALGVVDPLARLTAAIVVVAVVPPAVLTLLAVRKTLELVVISSLQLVTILLMSTCADLLFTLLLEQAIAHLCFKITLEIFCER
jgi:hypothetical protein